MESKKYRLRYLPLFEQDLAQAVAYIADVLKNPDAARRLVDDVEAAIRTTESPRSVRAIFFRKKAQISLLSDLY